MRTKDVDMGRSKADFYVATNGSDANPGTLDKPFATLARARDAVRELEKRRKKSIVVLARGGHYYLKEPLTFGPEDSGSDGQMITYAAYPGEKPTLSGGKKIIARWQPFRDSIWMCSLPEVREGKLDFTQLFVNGKRKIRARYPNYDASDSIKGGYIHAKGPLPENLANDKFPGQGPKGFLFDPKTFSPRKWAKPHEAVVHIFPYTYWGNLQWQIKDVDRDRHIIWFGRGGFQLNTKISDFCCDIDHTSRFYIENVFEELDTPGEWYLDKVEGKLFYIPEEGIDLSTAEVIAPLLKQVVEFRGSQVEPVRNITLSGFKITHTTSTFLEQYEVVSGGDWTIHRGGAVFIEGAVNCSIKNCFFDGVGGNGVFINNYNRHIKVIGNKFTQTGDSAVCLVGSNHLTLGSMETFPTENIISNNLIHDCGVFGKQIAGIFCAVSKRNLISHNLIYNMPRAGICMNDCFGGGHIIEYNEVYNTVRETSDHGPFNSWGKERYWCLQQSDGAISHGAGNVKVDAQETSIVRNNYFHEDHGWGGWGIVLDDGTSNYKVYNNLCVGISISLREGDYRTVENNIFVNTGTSVGFHVGYEYNHDKFVRNIIVINTKAPKPKEGFNPSYDGKIYTVVWPPAKGPWVEEIDYNLFFNDVGSFKAHMFTRDKQKKIYSLADWQALGYDTHSIFADAIFVDPANGDYRVKPESPALKLGFRNFDTNQIGLLPDFPKQWRE